MFFVVGTSLLALPLVVGITKRHRAETPTPSPYYAADNVGSKYEIRIIGRCEYLYFPTFNSPLTHKGDCTNSIHIYRVE